MTKADEENVRVRFDRLAAEWDSNPQRVALARAVADAICASVPLSPDMKAMDFGAGTGLLTLALLPHVRQMTAVDTSPEMLRVLTEKAKALPVGAIQTLTCDLSRARPPVEDLDLMVSSMVLHHVQDVPALLQRLRPCMRRGGWVAVADLDTEDGSFHPDRTGVYHNGFARETVCEWLRQAGFPIPVACDAHRLSRPAADGTSRIYPVFLVVAQAG